MYKTITKRLPRLTCSLTVAAISALCTSVLFLPAVLSQAEMSEIPDRPNDLVYVPKTLESGKRYPLLLILNAEGEPWNDEAALRPIADKYQWIIAGDRSFKKGPTNDMGHLKKTIENAESKYPVDEKRVFIGGVSYGAMGSYDFIVENPDIIKGILVNTGRMPWKSDYPWNTALPNPFPKNKLAAMLASPTDPRYKVMQDNKKDLEKQGWKIKWIEFVGGHVRAPEASLDAAIEWLNQQP